MALIIRTTLKTAIYSSIDIYTEDKGTNREGAYMCMYMYIHCTMDARITEELRIIPFTEYKLHI